ncbi:hypothetical protein HDR59_01000 [bacterium]|nr:hypothetical protein [bacterium]
MNNVINGKIQNNNKEKFILYIYPSDPEQIIYYGGKNNVQSECKMMVFDSLLSMMHEKLPVPPESMELVSVRKEKNPSKENVNVFSYLFICKDDDYVLLEDLPNVQPPLNVVKKFKVRILNIVNEYLKEYGKIISATNPVYYGRIKDSRDALQESYFSSTVDELNSKNKTTKGNRSKIYIFPTDIENALNKNAETKILSLNGSIADIKKLLPINIRYLHGYDTNQYILLSDDFSLLTHLPTQVSPNGIAMEYRKLLASTFAQKYFIENNKSMKPKEARALYNVLTDRINDDAFNFYLKSTQNQR